MQTRVILQNQLEPEKTVLDFQESKKIDFDSSVVSDTVHDIKEKIEIKDNKIPSILSLLRKKSISSMASFYPQLFWFTRRFTFIFIFLNEYRKSGIIYSIILGINAIKWKLKQIKINLDESDGKQALSLRKVLRKGHIPAITTDNPAMKKLRLGR